MCIHEDIRARTSVGMHFGTFILTDEPVDEPPTRLRRALRDKGVDEGTFVVFEHGEIRRVRVDGRWQPVNGGEEGEDPVNTDRKPAAVAASARDADASDGT